MLGQFNEHEPVERGRLRMRRQHALARNVKCRDCLLGVGSLCSRPRRPHLRKLRQVGVAQDETDVGMRDKPASGIHHIGSAGSADMDLIDDIPDVREIDLGHADAGIAACAGDGQRHERFGAAPEIDGSIIDLVGDGRLELFVCREVGVAADPVHGLPRNAQLLAPLVIQQAQLRNRRNLAQQSDAIELTLLHGRHRPGQMGRPAEMAFDLLDELGDLRGCRAGLLFLDANERGAMLADR